MRTALVFNFEDNNYTWMDASAIVDGALSAVTCMAYGFNPGWLATWADLSDKAVTWDDLAQGNDPWSQLVSRPALWSDFYSSGNEANLLWLTVEGVWLSDQYVDTTGVKQYFVERVNIDFDDIIQGATSNNLKHLRQLYPLLQSPPETPLPNTYDFTIGWSANLMDEPEYAEPRRIILKETNRVGKHKIDVRNTARYTSMVWDFTYTGEIAMTGVDVDLEESHGR